MQRSMAVRVPSARVYEYALHLSKALHDGADVGLEGIWRKTREHDGHCRGGSLCGGGGDLLARWLRDGCDGE